jgi:ATP-binding cassette, subfamily C, bacterial CydC
MFGLPKTKSFKLGVFVALLESASAIALIAASAFLISRASEQPPVLYLMMAVVGVRAFALGRAFFRYVSRLALHDAAFSQTAALRPVIFSKIADLSPAAEILGSGRNLSKMTAQVDEIQSFPVRIFTPLFQALAALGVSLTLVFAWFPISALSMAAIALGSFVLSQYLGGVLTSKSEAIRAELNTQLRAELVEYLQAVELISAYGWQAEFLSRIEDLTSQIEKLDKTSSVSSGLGSSMFSFVGIVAAAVSGYFAAGELETVPGYLLAVAVLVPLALFEVIGSSSIAASAMNRYRSAKNGLEALMNEKAPKRLDLVDGPLELDGFESLEISGVVNFDDRSVTIPTVKLSPGELVAVTGASGIGKSTLGYCLASLINLEAGRYLINRQPAEDFSLGSRRRIIGLSEQHSQLFPGTIEQNLAISGIADRGTQWAVLKKLGFGAELNNRGGLDLELADAGSGLSGGEAQRICIARALLGGARVLVLDEPTSGLDWNNSKRLIGVLREVISQGLSVVLITHDPQLAAMADRVIELR